MTSSVPYRRDRDAATEHLYHHENRPRKLSRFFQTLKSCFGRGSVEVDVPSRNKYRGARGPATGFEGEEVYGVRAEYLDEDDMAWGKAKKSRKQPRRDYGSYAR